MLRLTGTDTVTSAQPTVATAALDSVAARLLAEGAISLLADARQLPPTRASPPVSPSTLFRWATSGAVAPNGQRVRLETFRPPSGLRTSLQAVARFMEALTPARSTRADDVAAPERSTSETRTARQNRKASERAAAECARLGM